MNLNNHYFSPLQLFSFYSFYRKVLKKLFSFVLCRFLIESTKICDYRNSYQLFLAFLFLLFNFLYPLPYPQTRFVILLFIFYAVSSNPEELTIIAEANHRDYLFSLTFCINVITTGVLALAAPLIIATFYTLQGEKFLNVLESPLKAT